MRKIIYIFMVIISIMFVFVLFSYFAQQRTPKKPTTTKQIPTANETLTPTTIPEGPTTNIDGVTVNNFYKHPESQDKSGDYYIKDDPKTYQILYMAKYNEFLISILSSPFETVRKQAEAELLQKLNVSEQDACSLNVVETTPSFVNLDESGKSYKLSFCSQ